MISLRKTVPPPKTWWAKQITDELYTAGRLTESQFKNALEAGYRSVVSLYRYEDSTHIAIELVPGSERMRYLAGEVGLHYDTLHGANQNWMTKDNVEAIAKKLDAAPRPTLLHCNDSGESTLCILLYLSLRSKNKNDRFNSEDIFRHLHQQGFSCTNPNWLKLISVVTGETSAVRPQQPDVTVLDWYKKYWLVRPVYKNVYITGQIRSNYFSHLKSLGITHVFNLRYGLHWNGKPSQEEVPLQNIRCNTETYDEGGRQNEERLKATKLYAEASNTYIGESSTTNYQTRNPLEFGDDVGYNEEIMRKEIEEEIAGIKYTHTPCELDAHLTVENTWEPYKDVWLSTQPEDNVVFVCRVGFRAVVGALLMLGYRYKLPSEWAIRRAGELGFHFRVHGRNDVIELFEQVLGH